MPAWIVSKTQIREVRNDQSWLALLLKGGEDTLGPPQAPPPRLQGRTPADSRHPAAMAETPQPVVTPRPSNTIACDPAEVQVRR